MEMTPVANVNGCLSAKQTDAKEVKINSISQKALSMLGEGQDAFTTANFIRGESVMCFGVAAQSDRQDDILAKMRWMVCGAHPPKNVTIQEVSQVARDLGKERLNCD